MKETRATGNIAFHSETKTSLGRGNKIHLVVDELKVRDNGGTGEGPSSSWWPFRNTRAERSHTADNRHIFCSFVIKGLLMWPTGQTKPIKGLTCLHSAPQTRPRQQTTERRDLPHNPGHLEHQRADRSLVWGATPRLRPPVRRVC